MTPLDDDSSILSPEYDLFGGGAQLMMMADDFPASNSRDPVEREQLATDGLSMQSHMGHSVAIPISGRKSPFSSYSFHNGNNGFNHQHNNNGSKHNYAYNAQPKLTGGTHPKRLGGDLVGQFGGSFTESNRNESSFHGGIPGAPMPSPISPGHVLHHNNNNNNMFSLHSTVPSAALYSCSQAMEHSFSPQSPPFSPSAMALSAPKAQTNMVAASPRSFNESMFSFRPGSLSSLEQQLEKQKKRKENHNAVERRRRDMMNILISRLALLVTTNTTGLDPSAANKLNKGEVLEASVKRILLLNQVILELSAHLRQLDPSNAAVQEYGEIIASLVTCVPDCDIGGSDMRPDSSS